MSFNLLQLAEYKLAEKITQMLQ